ncbi:NAD(P)-binding protein [Sarocladium strictum]
MMRIAIAGGGGLGYLLATQISQAANAYNVVVLSRTSRSEYAQFDIQVQEVKYDNQDVLTYALHGIDLVISTVSGQEQLNLISAAGHARVRLFVPSEFEGSLSHRPSRPSETSRTLAALQQVSRATRMRYTVFSCGLFMERFHPHGLTRFNIGSRSGVLGPGELFVNLGTGTAEYAPKDARGKPVRVCLTSVYDLAKFIVAAIDHGPSQWPRELTLRGDRISVEDLVKTCSYVANATLQHHILDYDELQPLLNYYIQANNNARALTYQQMLDVADGRYDFSQASLNDLVRRSRGLDVQPMSFMQWFSGIWQSTS